MSIITNFKNFVNKNKPDFIPRHTKKDKDFGLDDFIKQINSTNNIEYLNEFVNKYIPIDRENLKNKNSVEIFSKMRNQTPEEYVKNQTEMIDKMEEVVKNRLKNLKDK